MSHRLEAASRIDPDAFAGVSSAGYPIIEPLLATIDAKINAPVEAIPAPWWGDQAHLFARDVEQLIASEVSDAGRSAAQAEMVAQGVTRYVRILVPPSCKRCAVLAGRIYKTSEPFDRHPGCDCTNEPVTSLEEALDRGLVVTPDVAYERGWIRDLSEAERQAIDDGAEVADVINASSGIYTATIGGRTVKATRYGTTPRSAWRKASPSQRVRLRPESIYNIAGDDHDKAIELLTQHGYLKPGATPRTS